MSQPGGWQVAELAEPRGWASTASANSLLDTAAAALRQAAATLGTLTPAQLADLAAGRGRLVFQAVEVSASGVSASGVSAAAEPTAAAPDRTPRRTAPAPPDPEVVGPAVRAIRGLGTPGEVAEHLRAHRYPMPTLRQIARELGPTVSLAARDRAGLERNIVEGTTGYLARSAAMSGGAWP